MGQLSISRSHFRRAPIHGITCFMIACPKCGSENNYELISYSEAKCRTTFSSGEGRYVPDWHGGVTWQPEGGHSCGEHFKPPAASAIRSISDPFDRLMTAAAYYQKGWLGSFDALYASDVLRELCPELVTPQPPGSSGWRWDHRFSVNATAAAAGFARHARGRIPFDWTQRDELEWVMNWRGKTRERVTGTSSGWVVEAGSANSDNPSEYPASFRSVLIREDGTIPNMGCRIVGATDGKPSGGKSLSFAGIRKMSEKLKWPSPQP